MNYEVSFKQNASGAWHMGVTLTGPESDLEGSLAKEELPRAIFGLAEMLKDQARKKDYVLVGDNA